MVQLLKAVGFIASLAIIHLSSASPVSNPQSAPAAIRLPLISRQKRVYVPHDHDTSNSTKRFRTADYQTWKGALYYDTTEYLIEVGIGTSEPPQKYYFVLDTGSNVMWVYSNGCPEEQCKPSRFNQDITSDSYKPTMEQVVCKYLDNTFIVGYMGSDVVTVGSIKIKNQEFVSIYEAIGVLHYDEDKEVNSIGMFGLAYPSKIDTRVVGRDTELKARDYETPLSNMKKQNIIPKGMFSMYLGPATKHGPSYGYILIGDYDKDDIKEEPKFVLTQLNTLGVPEDYALYLEGFSLYKDSPTSLNNDPVQTVIQASNQPSVSAINVIKEWKFSDESNTYTNIAFYFDTGTENSFLYPSYAKEVFMLITGATKDPQGNWDIDCQYMQSDIYLRLRISHNHKDVDAVSDPNPLYLDVPISAFVKKKDSCGCEWTLGAGTSESGNMMLGQDFLRYFYLVHDFDHAQLGFAVPKGRSSRVSLKTNAKSFIFN